MHACLRQTSQRSCWQTIQTCSNRKRRHSSPLSSGSSSCQRLEEPRLRRCEGRPCPGCHQTLQQWRQFQAAWWPRQISASLQQCLQSARNFISISTRNTDTKELIYTLHITMWMCTQDGHNVTPVVIWCLVHVLKNRHNASVLSSQRT